MVVWPVLVEMEGKTLSGACPLLEAALLEELVIALLLVVAVGVEAVAGGSCFFFKVFCSIKLVFYSLQFTIVINFPLRPTL